MYGQMIREWIHAWERKLSTRDKNRKTLPFEWGFEFLNHGFVPGTEPMESIFRFNEAAIEDSHEFFRHASLDGVELRGDRLSFPSSVRSPYPVNNTVRARLFPGAKPGGCAVIVLPQWNADVESHVALCSLLQKLGITALRLTLPYHEERNPAGPRADFLVSPNVGRTIQAIQQSVQDARRAADWLLSQGYLHLGIMGTSVGSCIGFLTFVHDQRFRVGVFHHVSSFFGDVVWKGISTQHVRKGLEGYLSKQQLREAWTVISPNSYVSRLRSMAPRKYLLISGRYDLTFPPDLSQLLFEEHDRSKVPYEVASLPCGHYTSALVPFKYLVGYRIARYFRKHLRKPAESFPSKLERNQSEQLLRSFE